MLGNFSFGDYFKEVAIELAWNLVTKELGLPAGRLLATVYAEDEDAFGLWRKIAGLDERRIIKIATSDNFWAMGDTGPCGPCSEIFYDHGPDVPGGPPGSADEDGDRFIEIWNLVFMQYEQVDKATRNPLPRPSIDTGMGLERIAAVCQGCHDNYDIDLFQTLIRASEELTGTRAVGDARASHKVIADHLRAAAFLVADGVMPANDGRGYVLRRIMRRGMRHAHLLGAREPLLWRLVPTLTAEMGKAYPELVRAESLIVEILKLEETSFRRTLERGLRLLDEETQGMAPGASLPGGTAFRLYDTYGFPLDLTQDALRAQGRSGRSRRLRRGDGPPARRRPCCLEGLGRERRRAGLVRHPRGVRADRVPGLPCRSGRGARAGPRRRRPSRGGGRPRHRGSRRHQPDAVLRRIRRAGRRHRDDAGRCHAPRGHRHPQEAGGALRPCRPGRGCASARGRRGSSW